MADREFEAGLEECVILNHGSAKEPRTPFPKDRRIGRQGWLGALAAQILRAHARDAALNRLSET
jgi:hypothetical protein